MRVLLLLIFMSLSLISKAVEFTVADSNRYTGFAVALAWPKVWAKEAGDGYDRLMRGLGFNDGGFYRVGHAALVLVNAADSSCHYFDFGRYHAPVGMGRVRSADTDHDLVIASKAVLDGKHILNIDEILCEVQSNASTHASGPMYASYVRIDFSKAEQAAKKMQSEELLPYGPFEKEGSNCSRFVRQIILAGEPNWAHALRLEVVPMITPSTLYPVSALYHWTKVPNCLDAEAEALKERLSSMPDSLFKDVIPPPELPAAVPASAQWLAGESSGSWYLMTRTEEGFRMLRYSATGFQECAVGLKQVAGVEWDGQGPFEFTYPSNCHTVTILVNGQLIKMRSIAH